MTDAHGRTAVQNVRRTTVSSAAEALAIVRRAWRHRAELSSKLHEHSSRSHGVVTVEVTRRRGSQLLAPPSALHLVDLAGSENAAAAGVAGAGLRESRAINRSLAALADVFSALSRRDSHVPYRNSRLTHMLKDCVGGDARVLLIVCVAPSAGCRSETLQSLLLGQRALQSQRPERRRGNLADPGQSSDRDRGQSTTPNALNSTL